MSTRLYFTLLFCSTILFSCGGNVSATRVHLTPIPNDTTSTISTKSQLPTTSPMPTVTQSPICDLCDKGTPDGWIVFTSTREDKQPFECITCNSEIYATDTDGKNVVRLSYDPAEDRSPVWSPDGMRIAFASTRSAGRSQIFVMNCDGSDVVQLTKSPNGAASPAWSPDGTRIAYIQTDDIADGEMTAGYAQDIYSMDPDGTHIRRLTNAGTNKSGLAWSPDGKSMLYTSYVEGELRDGVILYSFSIDTADVQPLTNEFGWVFSFDFSPDGKRIAFDNYQYPIRQSNIFLLDSDGANLNRLTAESPDTSAIFPAWSPNGVNIAYVSLYPGGNNISIIHADGSEIISFPPEPGMLRDMDWK
jgi:Tol biopolymer transport system component